MFSSYQPPKEKDMISSYQPPKEKDMIKLYHDFTKIVSENELRLF